MSGTKLEVHVEFSGINLRTLAKLETIAGDAFVLDETEQANDNLFGCKLLGMQSRDRTIKQVQGYIECLNFIAELFNSEINEEATILIEVRNSTLQEAASLSAGDILRFKIKASENENPFRGISDIITIRNFQDKESFNDIFASIKLILEK